MAEMRQWTERKPRRNGNVGKNIKRGAAPGDLIWI